jgi:hypothetical protein
MKITLLIFLWLVLPVCRGGPVEIESPVPAEATTFFGLPYTNDSQLAQINHTGVYRRRLTVRPFAPPVVSVRLQMFEPAVQAFFTDDICQPIHAFYPYRE